MYRIVYGFLTMAVMAVASCSSNNDITPDTDKQSGVMRLDSIYSNKYTISYKYDEQGRIVKYSQQYDTYNEVNVNYDLTDSKIYVTFARDYISANMPEIGGISRFYSDTIFIKNGLADSCSGFMRYYDDMGDECKKNYTIRFSYDANNQLTKQTVSHNFTENYTTVWEGGNIVAQYSDAAREDTAVYTYTTYPNTLQSSFFHQHYVLVQFRPLVDAGYFGALPKNLLESMVSGDMTMKYEYKFSNDTVVSLTQNTTFMEENESTDWKLGWTKK